MKPRNEIEPTQELYESGSVAALIKKIRPKLYEVWVGSDIEAKDFRLVFIGGLSESRTMANRLVKK